MGWTAPAAIGTDWSVGEVATAAKMNSHLSDNLRYLKGLDGAVSIDDRLTIPVTSGTNGKGLRFANGATDIANLQSLDLASNSYIFFATNRQFDGTAWQQLNTRAAGLVQITQDALSYSTFPAASSTPTTRFAIDNSGNVGIGTATPQSKLHVAGAGGGFLFLSASAVNNTLQTLAAAGTVTSGAAIYAWDHNNTGGGNVLGTQPVLLGLGSGGMTIVNNDTIKIDLTAGGAITVQRTAGTNGTHDVNMIVVYR
jgi:hypothetical protein